MNTLLFSALPRVLLMTALVCAACAARAQGSAPAAITPPPEAAVAAPAALPPAVSASDAAAQSLLDRNSQKIEHLHFEDAGSRVDEVRVGGQTRSITVQPKGGAPAYEVRPTSPNTMPDAGIGQTGPRVWRIHQF